MLTTDHLHRMTAGYITAALWADCMPLCDCGELDHGHLYARDDVHSDDCASKESGGLEFLTVHAEDYAYCFALCSAFAKAAGRDLETFAKLRSCPDGDRWGCVGHDLRLTSGGHGTGFWDRESKRPFFGWEVLRNRLSQLAGSRPFGRSGGGDVWQDSESTATFDHYPLDQNAAPGDRWESPSLTSAQRQAWIEEGRVPTLAEMAEIES